MTFDLRSFLYERSHTYFIIIFMKGNNQATFNTIITPFSWGPFWGLNARSPLNTFHGDLIEEKKTEGETE